jgi:hypothetical protein
MADLKQTINRAMEALPDREDILRRIAENLQERQLLRRMLKLVEQRQQPVPLTREGRRNG